ncbi:MAG: RNA polymerase sigma factor FliA [Sphingopyxis sp.]
MRHFDPHSCATTYTKVKVGPEQLIHNHIPLVRRIAWHMRPMLPGSIAIEDIIQVGMIALVEAAHAYEDRGHAFSTYATMRIRGAMVDVLRKNAHASRGALANRRLIGKTRAALEQQLHRAPMPGEMAAAMGLDERGYEAMAAQCEPVQLESIDDHYSDSSLWFASIAEGADEQMDRERIREQLAQAIRSLDEREAQILQLYFSEELNLEEIGQAMGIGAARVCQIKKRALERLRALLDDSEAQ